MKRKNGSLTLHRETLRALNTQKLEPAVGLAYTARCQYSGYATCGTCMETCGTNYC